MSEKRVPSTSLDHDQPKTDRRVMSNPVGQTKGELYVLQQWQLRSLRPPAQTQGRGEQDCMVCRLGPGCTGGRGLPDPRRSDAGKTNHHLGAATVAWWCAGRHQGAAKRLRDSRRARNGKSLRMPVGFVPIDPVAGDRGRQRARRVLLARQGRSETPLCSAPL